MKQTILAVYRCKWCNEIIKYYMRADNMNPDITDSDIIRIATNRVNEDKFDECPACSKTTVQEFIAIQEGD